MACEYQNRTLFARKCQIQNIQQQQQKLMRKRTKLMCSERDDDEIKIWHSFYRVDGQLIDWICKLYFSQTHCSVCRVGCFQRGSSERGQRRSTSWYVFWLRVTHAHMSCSCKTHSLDTGGSSDDGDDGDLGCPTCPEYGIFQAPDRTSCSRFIQCNNGLEAVHNCSAGMHFSIDHGICVRRDLAKCDICRFNRDPIQFWPFEGSCSR